MPKRTNLQLHSVSVTVTAQFHNPSIFNPDFLKSLEIVPDDWVVTETITTPPLSTVSFANGINWTVEQGKMTVSEACGPEFDPEYRAHGLVTAYVAKLPHVPYRHLGLNCRVSMRRRAPKQWLTRRFLKPGRWLGGAPKVLGMVPKIEMEVDDAVCNLTFNGGTAGFAANEQEPAVIVDCNFHHEGPLDVSRLEAAIRRWPERQSFLITALDKLLKSRQA